jgi:type III secretion protein C
MSALLQELRIHGLTMFERGNNIIIHKTPGVNAISRVVAEGLTEEGKEDRDTEIVTRLFRLNATDPEKAALILRPLVSDKAVIDVFKETNHIIVTDIVTNIEQISKLLKSIDAPNNGFVIGQYVVRQGFIDSLIVLAQQIMQPIAHDQTLTFVAHSTINSIFIVSTPFLMERTLAILQYLDQTQGVTRIFNLKDLKFTPETAVPPEVAPHIPEGTRSGDDQWILDNQGNWVFRPKQAAGVPNGPQPPEGNWYIDDQGNWHFRSGNAPPVPSGAAGLSGPEGQWKLDSQGIWVFQIAPGKSISPERLERQAKVTELPIGHIERTQFSIYRLHYRKGDQVQAALEKIATGLSSAGNINPDLLQAIENVQWIEASNALVITGTAQAIDKVLELIQEIDAPLRQVFIEMLILETTIDNSLQFGVDWATRFGGGNTAGSQGFLSTGSPLPIATATAGIGNTLDAGSLGVVTGFTQGIIGQRITHCGTQFDTIAALVTAIHNDSKDNIIMSPKILVEDNAQAEVFVGINTRFPTQAIANDQGSIITQNFDFRDVGTRLRVTPQISDTDIITLTIEEEVSSIAGSNLGTNVNVNTVGPTTNQNRTTTKVHLPNKYFLVISGIMQDEDLLNISQIPCVGGIPFLGGGFKQQTRSDTKRNLMIFIRPVIIDTEEDINAITSHEQKVWNYKNAERTRWKDEVDQALEFFNLPNGTECDCECVN